MLNCILEVSYMPMYIKTRNNDKGALKNTWGRMLAMVGLDFIVIWSLIADWPLKTLYLLGYILLILIFTAVGMLDLKTLIQAYRNRRKPLPGDPL